MASKELRDTISAVTADLIEMQAKIKKAQELAVAGKLQDAIAAILREYQGGAIALIAWTPGFNDGDPCTHSMEIMESQLWGGEWSSDELERIQDCIDDDTYKKLDQGLRVIGQSEHGIKLVRDLFGPLEDALEATYGTNWYVYWMLDDNGKIVTEKGYYDCEY